MTDTHANIPPRFARIATTADEVVAAWSFVHDRFAQTGLIDPQPMGILAPKQAISDVTLVVYGGDRVGGHLPVSTVTGVGDHEGGLPADSEFGQELDLLRQSGASLFESCLTASVTNNLWLLQDKLRHLWWFAAALDCTHIVFTSHPRQFRTYSRMIGFTQFGRDRLYHDRHDAPAVLGVLGLDEMRQLREPPRAVQYFLDHPIAPEAFESRYRFPAADRWRFAA